jgi:hypothetical protein
VTGASYGSSHALFAAAQGDDDNNDTSIEGGQDIYL